MEFRDRLSKANWLPIVMVAVVLSMPVVWLVGFLFLSPTGRFQARAVDWGWVVDTAIHLFALGVALGYGRRNRSRKGAVLAVLSPFLFVLLVAIGPWESTDGLFPQLPTGTNLAVAYAIANVMLAVGLWHVSGLTRDVADPGAVRKRDRPRLVLLVAVLLTVAALIIVDINTWWQTWWQIDGSYVEPPSESLFVGRAFNPARVTTTTSTTAPSATTAPEFDSAPDPLATTPTSAVSNPASTTSALPPIDRAESGLSCRDLYAIGYSYPDAAIYWMEEGSPDRMDTDRNGIPCETVYPRTDVVGFWGEPLPKPGSGGAYGSGCAPGTDVLPDGDWVGWVVERRDDRVEFDLVCLYVTPEEPHISNESSRLRTVPISDVAVVYPVTDTGMPGGPIPYPTWRSSPPSDFCASLYSDGCPLWLHVNDGTVTEIAEFWLP